MILNLILGRGISPLLFAHWERILPGVLGAARGGDLLYCLSKEGGKGKEKEEDFLVTQEFYRMLLKTRKKESFFFLTKRQHNSNIDLN